MTTSNTDRAYVRTKMLPEQPPPAKVGGVFQWVRDNLFSTPLNAILTIAAIAVIWFFVAKFGPWFQHSVWHASSLKECREIITERWGQGATGACFAVIRERWNQFMFGFYPRAEYWRPTLAFGLLFFALTPILFAQSRRIRHWVMFLAAVVTFACCQLLGAPKLALLLMAALFILWVYVVETRQGWALVASFLYPFFGVWLLWGGSLWSEIMVLLGFGILLLVVRLMPVRGAFAVGLGVVAAIIWWTGPSAWMAQHIDALVPIHLVKVPSTQFGGFLLSITIGIAGIAMSLPLGILLALGRQSNLPIVKMLSVMFIEFIRGVPLIGMLFVASLLLNYFLPPTVQFDIVLRVIIMVTLFASAYMAEVVRGGLAGLPKGQYEAAAAMGFDYWTAQRLIILPQALKISIPAIVSTFIGMFKDTTLVTFVGLFDPLKAMSDAVRASFDWKGTYWEPYLFTGAIFFIICFSMARYSRYLERRLKRDKS